ncbi:DUF4400 domain-containing protein [Shewanella bicestrii]
MSNENKPSKSSKDKTHRHGTFTIIVLFIMGLPIMALTTMVFSVIVEWGLIWGCNDDANNRICNFAGFEVGMGAEHSRLMLQVEAGYLNTHFKDSLMGAKPIQFAGKTLSSIDEALFKPLGIDDYKMRSIEERSWGWDYLVSAYTIVKVVILRLCILLLSLPAYVIFAGVGLVTGFVNRDLRKFGAGSESTDRYELSLKLISPSIILCFIVYLSWPNSINPAYVVVPFAAMFGYALHLTMSNYKKHF